MKKIIILGVAGLMFGMASMCFAATPIRIAATIGETHQMNVVLTKVEGTATSVVSDLVGTGMDFGTLTKGTDNVFRSATYFYVDAPVISNKTGWTITHTATDFANSAGNNLNGGTNVTFVRAITGGEAALASGGLMSYATAKTRTPIAQAELVGGWLRIYYGIASGSGDATGVNVITTTQPTGTYVGTITLTLSA